MDSAGTGHRAHAEAVVHDRRPEARGRLGRLLLDRLQPGEAADVGTVEAADGEERLEALVVRPVGAATGVLVRGHEQVGAVAVRRGLKGLRELGPGGLPRVEELGHADVELGSVEGPPVAGAACGDRARVELGAELVVRRTGVPAAVELAGRVGRARLEEHVEVLLEAHRLLDLLGLGAEGGVDGAVEDHRVDVRGEPVGVERPEIRPVGEPEIGELRVAECGADPVHVPGRPLARQIRQVGGVLGLTLVHERLHAAVERLAFRVGLRGEVQAVVGVEVRRAADRRAPPDAACVPPHDVEPGPNRRRERRGALLDELHTRGARAAGVHEQRPDACAGALRQQADERQADGGAVRLAVVERDAQTRALKRVVAARPVQ